MMPPPKARPKSHSDTSEELRRNLIDSNNNSFDNNFFQEEMSKISKENDEQNYKNVDDSLSISQSNESFINEKSNIFNNSNNFNSINSPSFISNSNFLERENRNNSNSFNFNMVNYIYNDNYDNEDNNNDNKNLEKLKLNLTSKSFLYNKFQSLATPSNKKEIKVFVFNLEKYISDHLFDSNLNCLKIKLQTRYNDYRNKGLHIEYFKKVLEKMQKELISRISKLNNGDKKIEIGKLNCYRYYHFYIYYY